MKFISRALSAGLAFLLLGACAEQKTEVVVYKSPTCGCCTKWVDHMTENGFQVISHDVSDMGVVKGKYEIRPDLESCHTAVVNGYIIEGHVPADDIKRFLKNPPGDAIGLSVPQMPMGSPGMEGPRSDPYNVLMMTKSGQTQIFSSH